VSDLNLKPGVPLGRPIVTLADAMRELFAKGIEIQSRVRLLSVIDSANVAQLDPQVGDIYFVQRGSAAACDMYVQLAVRPRLRFKVTGVLEVA